jgi:hypothetical protein
MKNAPWVILASMVLAVSTLALDPSDLSTFEPGQLFVFGKVNGAMLALRVSLKQMPEPYQVLGLKVTIEPSHTLLFTAFEPSADGHARKDFLIQTDPMVSMEGGLSEIAAIAVFPVPPTITTDNRIRVEYLISMGGVVSSLMGMEMKVQDLREFAGSVVPPSTSCRTEW